MDIDEILSIFQVSDHTAFSESEFEGSSNCSLSESDGSSPEEDFQETNEEGVGCNFKDETAVDSVTDLEKINLKEISIEDVMRYHFPDREVAFMFYNWYGCFHGFAARKSRVIRNIKGEVVQQTFLCHREGLREETMYIRHLLDNILVDRILNFMQDVD